MLVLKFKDIFKCRGFQIAAATVLSDLPSREASLYMTAQAEVKILTLRTLYQGATDVCTAGVTFVSECVNINVYSQCKVEQVCT